MAHIRIEMDRGQGRGWELRSGGDVTATIEQVIARLPAYAVSYPHRALINGEVVATAEPKR